MNFSNVVDFVPTGMPITAQFPDLCVLVAACVYRSRKGVVGVARDLGMQASDLSKRLNPDGPESRPLRVCDFVGILSSTGDLRPVYWLIEKFLRDPEATRNQAIAQLAQLMPMIQALVEQSGDGKIKAVK